ncbi:MAG TPA: lantibiotic dehydratase [Candidatus Angelobacter sp.]|nr:lantibiotic dehydratase [Candidatus Angelobacter sp.]
MSQALCNGGDLASATASDRKLLRTRLQQFVERPEVKEALWLASPDFFSLLSVWKQAPEGEKGQRLEQSLYRYVARMTSRPTPFGLFAGCSVGKIGAETQLKMGPRAAYWRRSRLDMEYLCNLAQKISSDPLLQPQFVFRPNTSLYLAAGRYHHAQSYLSDDVRSYRLIATEPTRYLADTLERGSAGATAESLASALVRDNTAITMEEALEYVLQLIESQILVSDLVPAITGPEPIEDMLAQLDGKECSSVKTGLRSIAERLCRLDQAGVGNDLGSYQGIVNTISELPADFKREHLVQVDLMKPADEACLDQRLVHDILRAVDVLHSLSSSSQDPFKEFKEDFRERYEDQAIPLTLALDHEVGIGFETNDNPGAMPEPLIENLNLRGAQTRIEANATRREFVLLRKLQELTRQKNTVLELDDDLLKSLRTENPLPLPDAFAVLGSLVDGGQMNRSFHLHGVSGPSGANLLGRFCHADDRLTDRVREHLRAEEEAGALDNVVFAEVAHLPEGRIGNILYRPVLRAYELPFLATSRAPRDRQISVGDLMVAVKNDRVVLRSQRLGCEVIPRLTSAHSFTHDRNLKLYKFLCLLQRQGLASGLSWNWGILYEASFLPRVVIGNIVLAPARWLLTKDVIEKLSIGRGSERLRRIHEWRTGAGVPRFALLAERDNELLIDFENALSMETLIEYVKKRESALLLEMFPAPDDLCARGPEGTFTHEVVIPLVRAKPRLDRPEPLNTPVRLATRPRPATVANGQRSFLPGSEWLFAKIYASPSQLDRLLVEDIKPLVEKVLASADAEGWFFIRYGDPDWHLRLRFHGNPQALSARVLPQLWECLDRQQQGRVWRVQLDTYEREVERYGGLPGVRIAESLFQIDSELVLALLTAIAGRLGTDLRWHLGCWTVDTLLASLGLDVSARRKLVNNLEAGQEQKFQVNQRYKKQLSEKFRSERQRLEGLLTNPAGHAEVPPLARSALELFARRLGSIRTELERAQQSGDLTKSIPELAGSYVHMHLNRLFRSAANAQEMVLYDFLARTYDSRMAREKQVTSLSTPLQ